MIFLARKRLYIKFIPFYSFFNKNQLIASSPLPAKWRLSFYLAYSNLFSVEVMIFLDLSFSFEKINFAKWHKSSTSTSWFGPEKCCVQTRTFLLRPVELLLNVCQWYIKKRKKHMYKFSLNLLNLYNIGLQCSASILQWSWVKQMETFADSVDLISQPHQMNWCNHHHALERTEHPNLAKWLLRLYNLVTSCTRRTHEIFCYHYYFYPSN